jgi:hypothetical protein
MKNELYWSYNVPLQYYPPENGSPGTVLNYSPRKNRVMEVEIDELLGEQTLSEFLNSAADHLENLAKEMRISANDPWKSVYFHDQNMIK